MLNTNKIIDNQFIIENRLKKSIIEFNYLKEKLLENKYINDVLKNILNIIIIDSNIINNPIYNFWTKTVKDVIKYGGLKEDNDYNWNRILFTIDSDKYERVFDKLILDLLSIRLFCDLAYSKNSEYKINLTLYNGFHITLYYKTLNKIKVSKFTIKNGQLFINNTHVIKGTGCNNDLKLRFYFLNDSSLKFLCNNVPSIIIDEKKLIKRKTIKKSFKILDTFFENDLKELMKFCEYAYMIYSNDNNFFSGNDEINLGLIYLPNINNEYYLSECILHELLHQKLCNLEDIARIFEGNNHLKEKYYSPWRDDARPIRMILHGLYVFTAIAEYWNFFINDKKLKHHALENCYYRIMQNKSAIKILKKYAKLTRLGIYIVEEIEKINIEIERNLKNKINERIKSKIKIQVLEHKKLFNSYVS